MSYFSKMIPIYTDNNPKKVWIIPMGQSMIYPNHVKLKNKEV